MTLNDVRALTFDTGGTILDWHTGLSTALGDVGARHGVERNWHDIANEMRRRSLRQMVNLGGHEPLTCNFDDAHRSVLDQLLVEHELDTFTDDDRHAIAYDAAHNPRMLARLPRRPA